MGSYFLTSRLPEGYELNSENVIAYGGYAYRIETSITTTVNKKAVSYNSVRCFKQAAYIDGDRAVFVTVFRDNQAVSYGVLESVTTGSTSRTFEIATTQGTAYDSTTGLYYKITDNNPYKSDVVIPDLYSSLRELLDACNDGNWGNSIQSIPVVYGIGGGYDYNVIRNRSIANVKTNHLLTREEVA